MIMVELDNLKKLTAYLALELENKDYFHIMDLLGIIFNQINTLILVIDKNDKVIYMNKKMTQYFRQNKCDVKIGDVWYKFWGMKKPPIDYPAKEAIKKKTIIKKQMTSPVTNTTFDIIAIPLIYDGVSGTINIINPEGS